jgi:hypothetical protein
MYFSLGPQYYYPVYLLLITVLIFGHFIRIYPMGTDKLLKTSKGSWQAILLTIVLTVFIGLRPVSGRYFGDMGTYAWLFHQFEDRLADTAYRNDILFMEIMKLFAENSNVNIFFLFIETLYIVPILLACRRLTKLNNYTLVLFAFSAMSFFSYGTNGIRNGAATSIFLLALTFLRGSSKEKIVFLVLSVIAFLIHGSIIVPIVAAIAAYFIKNPKLMFYFWGAALFLSIFAGGAMASLLSSLGIEQRLSTYLAGPGNIEDHITRTGFRWDFLLYSSMPIVLGWWVIFKRKIYTRSYALLLGTYIYANIFWLMVIRAPYSNRFAYLSWFLYPIVLAYPMLVMPVWKKAPGFKLGIIMVGHLAFTLFMAYKYSF